MARMLGAEGFAGTGCSPRCRRTRTPRPKRNKRAQRSYEKSQWLKEYWPTDLRLRGWGKGGSDGKSRTST